MSSEIGQAATRIALFLLVAAGVLLLTTPRDSAEFVVLVLTIGIGLSMLGVVAFLARAGSPRWDQPRGPLDGPLSGPQTEDVPDEAQGAGRDLD